MGDVCATIQAILDLQASLNTQLLDPDFEPTTPEAAAIKRLHTSGIRVHKPKRATRKNAQNKPAKVRACSPLPL